MVGVPGGIGYRPSRCNKSGRFTPAAATFISTSCAPGVGTGRKTGINTSGPPGAAGSMAVMVVGICMAAVIDSAARAVNRCAMFDEDLPRKKSDILADLAREDLDRLSIADLDDRIAALESELVRTKAKRDGAASFRAAADTLKK